MYLVRTVSTPAVTLGSIVDDDGTMLVPATLELPWRENQSEISCIPNGDYEAAYREHPKHGWCYEILNVPDRTSILIHAGNTVADSEGCVITGMRRGTDGVSVEDSRAALADFMAAMNTRGYPTLPLHISTSTRRWDSFDE